MKKGNRVLAFFLAVAMVFTSITWDFNEAKAEETTNAITTTDDGVSINFDNIDVAELDAAGYTSTRFKGTEVIAGEVNKKVSEHWFSGDGDDTPYGDVETSTIKAKNIGLKTDELHADDSDTFMYTPYTYEDFEVSAEIYYGGYTGIVFGEKNAYPMTDGTASSVAVYFNGGNVNVAGAITRSTAKLMRGNSTANIADNGNYLGQKLFNTGSKADINDNPGTVRTLHVKKTGDHLIIWVSGCSGVMTIELSDLYKTGSIGIRSDYYDTDGGGFKSLNIQKVHATEHHELDNVDMSVLDDQGYTATSKSNGVVAATGVPSTTTRIASVDAVFSSGTPKGTTTTANTSVVPKESTSDVKALNIPYIYDNFRLEAEVYLGQLVGVAVGDATSYPQQSKMVTAFFNNSWSSSVMFQLAGAYSGLTRTGGLSGSATGSQFRPSNGSTKLTPTTGDVYTIVLEVNNGTMKLWLKGYDGYGTATVTSACTVDKISLIARNPSSDGGGFKSYTITNLDAGDCAEFDNVYLQNLDAAGYKARANTTSSTLQPVSESGLWFSGDDTKYSANETNKNEGLKPNNTDGNYEILNIPHAYDNFRLKANVYHGQVVGVKIGKETKNPQIGQGTAASESISIYINGENLAVCGAIDYESRQLNGAGKSIDQAGAIQYKPTGNGARWNQPRTLIIEVQNGILSVSFEDLNHVFRVALDESYETESIALFARQYNTNSNGQAGGGFKGYEIETLPETYNIGTTVDIAGHTDFDHVDMSVLDNKGFSAIQYDKTSYNVTGAEGSVSNYMFAGEIGLNSAGNVVNDNNAGLKPKLSGDNQYTVLNTPYSYDNFRMSAEVYWGAYTGIVLGTQNVFPTSTADASVRIYFNEDQIQLSGNGFEPDSVVASGGATWSKSSYVFKPSSYTHTAEAVYRLNIEMIDGVLTIWLDGYQGVITFKMSEEYLAETNKRIALTARKYDGDGGALKSLDVQEIENIAKPYKPADFATYRGESYTTPTYQNYLFAGWYYDEACEQNVGSDIKTVEETVYAKFVPKYILDIKAQVSAHLSDEFDNDESGQIRFVTTVDSLKYSQVGFKVTYMKDGVQKDKGNVSNEVYPTLDAVTRDKTPVIYEPTDFCPSSIYFKAYTIKNVGQDYFDTKFTATAYWITKDGTTVEGETRDDFDLYSHWKKRAVHLSDNGSDETGIGSPNRPYQTLNNAIAQVEDNGTVYINDTCTVSETTKWQEHNKTVVISGVKEGAASVLQATADMPRFCIEDAATFRNMTFKLLSTTAQSVHAEGHSVTIESSVKVEGVKEIYGGSRYEDVESTDLKLYSGTYEKIYGGSYEKSVGNTNLVVGGNVNKGVSQTTAWSNHDHVYMIFGGSEIGTVTGNTNVTIETGAEAIYVYGGGRAAGSQVLGSTNVNFAGKAMGIYGGSGVGNKNAVGGTSSDTNVIIKSGEVDQLFGGSESTSIIGNVNVQILGGTVTRRIYGGCYNDYDSEYWTLENPSFWGSTNRVTGHTNVIIGAGATINVNSGDDHGLLAISRYDSIFDGEWGTIIFKDGIDLSSKLGSNYFSTQSYHYLVKATSGGEVVSANGLLYVTPETGYTATVTYGSNNTEISANENGTYTLPTLANKNSQTTVTVTFSK